MTNASVLTGRTPIRAVNAHGMASALAAGASGATYISVGPVAQLGERLLDKQEVVGSSPAWSTAEAPFSSQLVKRGSVGAWGRSGFDSVMIPTVIQRLTTL